MNHTEYMYILPLSQEPVNIEINFALFCHFQINLTRRHIMLPKLLNFLLIFLIATAIRTDARRSRIDLPISNPAEAPAMDNVATASGDESQEVKVPAPASIIAETAAVIADEPVMASKLPLVMPAADNAVALAADTSDVDIQGSVAEMEEECDPDMIGFEIVTG